MNSFSFSKVLQFFSFICLFWDLSLFQLLQSPMMVYLVTVLISGNGELVFSYGEGTRETFITFYEWKKIYSARFHAGTVCYSCACRGPMDAWWYFEEGRAPQPIRWSVSYVKHRLSFMLFMSGL